MRIKADAGAFSDEGFKEICAINFDYGISCGMRIICPEDSDYPDRLKNIYDPPLCLYIKGRLPDETKPVIAVVGTRKCTEYGLRTARYFGKAFTESGFRVISGMALGIDSCVQREVLANGGETFAVLGSGADVPYPYRNKDLYARLINRGGIISEIPPAGQPEAVNFPRRNRIISALSDGVLVIEAYYRSGSLITANYGLEQGKEVFAVPGRIDDPSSAGCLDIIRSGATPVTGINDILCAFNMT